MAGASTGVSASRQTAGRLPAPAGGADAGFSTLSLISSIGAGIIGIAMCVFLWNIYVSARAWATSSPPPPFNFNLTYPVPRVRSYAPLLDHRERALAPQRREA
jgi:cytochrome c oxidase subunit I